MRVPEEFEDIPFSRLVTTPGGTELLRNEHLRSLSKAVCESAAAPERTIIHRLGYANHTGGFGAIWRLDGIGETAIALKISSPTTRRKTDSSVHWENLVGQTIFMRQVSLQLEDQLENETIFLPDQYFALQTPAGSFLQAQAYLDGYISLDSLTAEQGYSTAQKDDLYRVTQQRIASVTGGLALRLRLGLNDLGLSGREKLHGHNVLVAQNTPDPSETELYIIDQPRSGIIGNMAIRAAEIALQFPATDPELIDIRNRWA